MVEPEPDSILEKVRSGTDRLDELRNEMDIENHAAFHSSLISLVEDGRLSIFPVRDVVKLRLDE